VRVGRGTGGRQLSWEEGGVEMYIIEVGSRNEGQE
jgi:hypothetical protein